jgi:hypothetical protein
MDSLVTTRNLNVYTLASWRQRRSELHHLMAVLAQRREEARQRRAEAGHEEGKGPDGNEGDDDCEDAVPLQPMVVEGRLCKPCPRCGIMCDRFTGCNHVTCRVCSATFMWCCLVVGSTCAPTCGKPPV